MDPAGEKALYFVLDKVVAFGLVGWGGYLLARKLETYKAGQAVTVELTRQRLDLLRSLLNQSRELYSRCEWFKGFYRTLAIAHQVMDLGFSPEYEEKRRKLEVLTARLEATANEAEALLGVEVSKSFYALAAAAKNIRPRLKEEEVDEMYSDLERWLEASTGAAVAFMTHLEGKAT